MEAIRCEPDTAYFTQEEAALRARATKRWLQARAHKPNPPPRIKLGAKVLYPAAPYDAWLLSHREPQAA